MPDLTGTKPLVDIVGLPRALELCLTGRTVGAAEAARLRLAELVLPGAELDGAVAIWWPRCSRWSRPWPGPPRNCCSRRRGTSQQEQAAAERRTQAALQRAGRRAAVRC